jgi:hypothetical protein
MRSSMRRAPVSPIATTRNGAHCGPTTPNHPIFPTLGWWANLEGAHSEMVGTPEDPTLHALVKRLAEVVGPPAKPSDDQNS